MSDQEAKGKQMTDEELLTLIGQYEKAALGSETAAGGSISTTVAPNSNDMPTLEIDRYDALNMYYARPLGNEIEDRSQVVIPELRDTIEWIMPQLMRMFTGSKQPCRFEPHGPDDVEQAQLETDAVNHIFMKENNGFFVLHDFIKDALLLRNGYAKVFTETETETSVERYSGILETELPRILQPATKDEEVDVVEQNEYTVTLPAPILPPQMPGMPQPPAPPPMTAQCFDLKIRRKSKKKKTRVECIPPEEMRVSADARMSLEKLPFAGHVSGKTRSALIAEGYDKEVINGLPQGKQNFLEMDELARNSVTDQLSIENPSDFAMQTVEHRDLTMLVDYDGDGIAELRHIVVAGDKILDNEEIDETPMVSCSPIRMPHRHTGISYKDLLGDLQVIKTMLFRSALDNLYLANNGRTAVDWQNVNIDDMMTSRPGGVVRTRGNPAESIMPITMPSNLTEQILPALGYVDTLREMRTGVGKTSMGIDADALQDVTKGGQLAAMSAASLKIELVARLIAEGVKDIFKKIHGEIIRNQDQEMMFEISGKWVTIDPTSWRKRTKMTVNVGLGSGNREEGRQNVMVLQGMQEKIANFGLIGPKQAYASFKMGVDLLGFENASEFAMDPASPEYKQHQLEMQQAQQNAPPPPQIMAAKIKAQSDQQIANSQNQREVVKLQGQLASTQAQEQASTARSQAEIAHAAIQNDYDRANDSAGNDMQMRMAILKVLGSIITSQLKQQPGVDAGTTLQHDYSEVRNMR